MSEKRRGLGRGLGALIPTGPQAYAERPSDVFFRDRAGDPVRQTPTVGGAPSDAPSWESFRPTAGQVFGPDDAPDVGGLGSDGAGEFPAERRELPRPEGVGSRLGATPEADPSREQAGTEQAVAASEDDAEHHAESDALQPVPGARYVEVPIESIRANPRQPRSVFDEDELAELTESIRGVGLLQPIVIRPVGPEDLARGIDSAPGAGAGAPDAAGPAVGSGGESSDAAEPTASAGLRAVKVSYELVMGERRWRAARAAGLATVPAIVKETPDDAMLRDALLENLHRSQLNPLDEAAAYQQLLEDFGCTQEELATRIGRSRSQISNTVRLLRLPSAVALRVAAGVLSAGHARALLALDDPAAMERLAQRIVAEGLSVRSVEEIVALGDAGLAPQRRTREPAPPNERLEHIAARLADRLDTRVVVAMGRRRGKLTVEFADPDDLDRILVLLEAGAEPVSMAHG